jgi:hypothetical protein
MSAVSLPLQITSVDSGVACIRNLKREPGAAGGLVDINISCSSQSAQYGGRAKTIQNSTFKIQKSKVKDSIPTNVAAKETRIYDFAFQRRRRKAA